MQTTMAKVEISRIESIIQKIQKKMVMHFAVLGDKGNCFRRTQ